MSVASWANYGTAVLTLATAVLTWRISVRLHKVAVSTDRHVDVIATAARVQSLQEAAVHVIAIENAAFDAGWLWAAQNLELQRWQHVSAALDRASEPTVSLADVVGEEDAAKLGLLADRVADLVKAINVGIVSDVDLEAQRIGELVVEELPERVNESVGNYLETVYALQRQLRSGMDAPHDAPPIRARWLTVLRFRLFRPKIKTLDPVALFPGTGGLIDKARAVEDADFGADGRYTPELALALDELHTALRGIEPEQESASQE